MKISKEFKIGVFVVVVLTASFFLINYLRGEDIFNREMEVISRYENVEGLVASAPVYIKGYKAGKVTEVVYNPEYGHFEVTCSILKVFRVPEDSKMTIYAVDIMGGSRRFMFLGHTPRALKKSFFEDFFKEHEDLIIRNIHHKFRNAEQFNSQELFYISESREGRCKVLNTDKRLVYLNPKRKKGYIDRKLAMFDRRKDAIFCCVNALSLADSKEQMKIMEWVRNRIYQNLQPSP